MACVFFFFSLGQAMDSIKKLQSSYPKDDLKRLEKEVSCIKLTAPIVVEFFLLLQVTF